MATKNYMINDKWLDLDKQNIVELQSVDGMLDSLKVNGSEIETPSGKITITENGTDIDVAQYALADVNVEGGGGSSDFSTAEVTVNGVGGFTAEVAALTENGLSGVCFKSPLENSFTVVLYQGETIMQGNSETPDFTIPEGETNIVYDEENDWYVIKGDCTITIS